MQSYDAMACKRKSSKTEEKPKEGKTDAPAKIKKSKDEKSSKELILMGKKGSSPKVSGYYKIDGDKVTREKKICSRCGKGVFMSAHKDRRSCGKCGLTEFI